MSEADFEARVQKLPIGKFQGISDVEQFTARKIAQLVEKDKHGYLQKVDIVYPKKLQKSLNELPFLAERMKIDKVEKL